MKIRRIVTLNYLDGKIPEDIVVDNYGLKESNIEKDERRKFENATFLEESDLYFSKEDLARLDSVILR